MSQPTQVSRPGQDIGSEDIESFDSLSELALDLRSSWNHATDEVWRQLEPELWDSTHNPWVVLQTVSRRKLQHVLAAPAFRKTVGDLVQARREIAQPTRWAVFQSGVERSGMAATATMSVAIGVGMKVCWVRLRAVSAAVLISMPSGQGSGRKHQLRDLPRWLHAE